MNDLLAEILEALIQFADAPVPDLIEGEPEGNSP